MSVFFYQGLPEQGAGEFLIKYLWHVMNIGFKTGVMNMMAWMEGRTVVEEF